MARGDHFPFFWPIAVTVVLAAIPAVLIIVARLETARFDDPGQRARECVLAAEIARQAFVNDAVQSGRFGLPPHRTGVDPELRGLSRQGTEALLPRFTPARLRFFLPLPNSLDCSAEFKRRHVPLLERDMTDAHFSRLSLSRIVFSPDGSRAFLSRGTTCEGLCGSGADMTWRRKDGKWRLESFRTTWIS